MNWKVKMRSLRFEEFVLRMWYLHRDECDIYGDTPLSLVDYETLHYTWLREEFRRMEDYSPNL